MKEIRERLTPIAHAKLQGKDFAANANVLEESRVIRPKFSPSLLFVQVQYSVNAVFSAIFLSDGTRYAFGSTLRDTATAGQMQAGKLYQFSLEVRGDDEINFQFDATGTIRKLTVTEIPRMI